MMKACWILVAALAAMLLGVPAGRAGEDKAKDLFDKMEKKLTSAKTLQVESDSKGDHGGSERTEKSKLFPRRGEQGTF
jgi:hypothetical protein